MLALAKYLVEHGLVSPGEMDSVLQRQVIFGGSLDTNLLELGLIDEQSLTEALSEVHRLPMASPDLLEQRDPRIVNLFPARLSEKYKVIPVMMSGRSVFALSSARVHPLVAEEIGFMLSLTVKIYLVCEARLHILLSEWLGLDIDPRYAALAERLGKFDVRPPRTADAPEIQAAREALSRQDLTAVPVVQNEQVKSKVEKVLGGIEAAARAEQVKREMARTGKISAKEAMQVCLRADDRDTIVDTALRFARQFVPYVGLFIINNDYILGWDAVGTKDARERIRKFRVSTGVSSVLSMVTQTRAYYLGPVSDSVGNNELFRALGRSRPRNLLVVPIHLQKRLIGLLYADAGRRSIRGSLVSDLLVFTSRLSFSFEQLIRKKKGESPVPKEPVLREPAAKPAAPRPEPDLVRAPPPEPRPPPVPAAAPALPVERTEPTPAPAIEPSFEPPAVSSGPDLFRAPPAAEPSIPGPGSALDAGPPMVPAQPAPEPSIVLEVEAPPPATAPSSAGTPDMPITSLPLPPPTAFSAVPAIEEEEPVVVNEDFINSGQILPAVEAAALGIPPAEHEQPAEDLHPDEERVRLESLSDESLADFGTVSIVDDETEVVIVETDDGFIPKTAESAPRPAVVPLKERPEPPSPEASAARAAELETDGPPAAAIEVRPQSPIALSVQDLPMHDVAEELVTQPEARPADLPPPPSPDTVPELPEQPEYQEPDHQQIEALAIELVCGDQDRMFRARESLVAIGPAAIDAIIKYFPGSLRFNVREAHDTIPPLAEHSELLRCLIEIGPQVCPAVATRLEDAAANIRYYAVCMFAAAECPRYVPLLARRLYDRDALIRLTTIDVLQTYRRTSAFQNMLADMRARLRDADPNQQAIAAALLGNFKDRDALPGLSALVKSPHKMVARAAAESLSYITKQDFGTSERKWLKWWKSHKGESRIQWLISGLRSKNRDIRFSSAQELNHITNEYFGYYFDSKKEDREKAVREWELWWQVVGRQTRFDD